MRSISLKMPTRFLRPGDTILVWGDDREVEVAAVESLRAVPNLLPYRIEVETEIDPPSGEGDCEPLNGQWIDTHDEVLVTELAKVDRGPAFREWATWKLQKLWKKKRALRRAPHVANRVSPQDGDVYWAQEEYDCICTQLEILTGDSIDPARLRRA